ncbi:MAG: DNA-binding protein [Defluviitaleaceae bacterium]|nr:DNA-binding protein [Defluviitaleaceae bacterium]
MNKLDLPAARQHKNMLFDFYGALLTERQREIFAMHHMEDNSLAEIGATMGVTPQAVADLLKRSAARLNRYEEQLGLVKKHISNQSLIEEINRALLELEALGMEDAAAIAVRIRKLVETLTKGGV